VGSSCAYVEWHTAEWLVDAVDHKSLQKRACDTIVFTYSDVFHRIIRMLSSIKCANHVRERIVRKSTMTNPARRGTRRSDVRRGNMERRFPRSVQLRLSVD